MREMEVSAIFSSGMIPSRELQISAPCADSTVAVNNAGKRIVFICISLLFESKKPAPPGANFALFAKTL